MHAIEHRIWDKRSVKAKNDCGKGSEQRNQHRQTAGPSEERRSIVKNNNMWKPGSRNDEKAHKKKTEVPIRGHSD